MRSQAFRSLLVSSAVPVAGAVGILAGYNVRDWPLAACLLVVVLLAALTTASSWVAHYEPALEEQPAPPGEALDVRSGPHIGKSA